MKTKLLKVMVLTCTLSALPSTSFAEHSKAPALKKYVGAGANYAFYNKIDGNFANRRPPGTMFGQVAFGGYYAPWSLTVEGSYYSKKYHATPKITLLTKSIKYNIKSMFVLANLRYHFQNLYSVQPYVGLGLGAGHVKSRTVYEAKGSFFPRTDTLNEDYITQKKKYSPAYQICFGANKSLNKAFEVNAEMKLLSLGEFADAENKGRIYQGILGLGIKYII